jgi:hypothetical protein
VACAERQDAAERPPGLDSQPRARLRKALLDTSARAKNASEDFWALLKETPSGLPHPDGAQRIQNASQELSIARAEMESAHSRLNLYLSRGILPGDDKMRIDEQISLVFFYLPYLSANSRREYFACEVALLKLLADGWFSPNTCPGIGASIPPNRRSPLPLVPLFPQAVHKE